MTVGFFRDIKAVSRQSRGLSEDRDSAQEAPDGVATTQAINEQLARMNAALSAPPGDAISVDAQVVSTGSTTGMLNNNPIVPVELLILEPGGTPRPVSTSVVVPMTHVHRLAPGATVPVRLSASNPSALALDWSTPA